MHFITARHGFRPCRSLFPCGFIYSFSGSDPYMIDLHDYTHFEFFGIPSKHPQIDSSTQNFPESAPGAFITDLLSLFSAGCFHRNTDHILFESFFRWWKFGLPFLNFFASNHGLLFIKTAKKT